MTANYSEKWIGIEEAAEHLGVTKDTIRNWIKKTDIVGYDTGGYTGSWGSYGKLGVLHEKEMEHLRSRKYDTRRRENL